MKIGNGSIPLRLGNLINVPHVFGGPYRNCPDDMFGVKMAAEIPAACDVSIPTEDFQVPEYDDVRKGVMKALMAMINGEDVYAGCMGGIGRTGLFLGVLAKIQIDYRKAKHRAGRGDDPVLYVREHFIPHAIETQEQQDFVRNFDTTDIIEWIDVTQRAMGLNIGFQKKAEVEAGHQYPGTREEWENEDDWVDPVDKQISDMLTRDLKAFDEFEETDSADELPELQYATWSQFDSLQSQIDEMQEEINLFTQWHRVFKDTMTITVQGREQAMIPCLRTDLTEAENTEETAEEGLTTPNFLSKIRSIFRR